MDHRARKPVKSAAMMMCSVQGCLLRYRRETGFLITSRLSPARRGDGEYGRDVWGAARVQLNTLSPAARRPLGVLSTHYRTANSETPSRRVIDRLPPPAPLHLDTSSPWIGARVRPGTRASERESQRETENENVRGQRRLAHAHAHARTRAPARACARGDTHTHRQTDRQTDLPHTHTR